METYMERYQAWFSSDTIDADTKAELTAIADTPEDSAFRLSG